jgi:hypothetical protein
VFEEYWVFEEAEEEISLIVEEAGEFPYLNFIDIDIS